MSRRRRPTRKRPPPPDDVRMASMEEVGPALVVLSYPLTAESDAFAALSPAEAEVAKLAIRGHSNARIAAARGTRLRTVANQMASVLSKLGVGSRHELAVRYAHVVRLEDPR